MNLESSYRSADFIPKEKPVKEPWKFPENLQELLNAVGCLGLIYGLNLFITGWLFRAFMVPNDKIPHTDPMVVTVFLILAGITAGIGSLILLTSITVFLGKIILGQKS